jgi:hypothetical protein
MPYPAPLSASLLATIPLRPYSFRRRLISLHLRRSQGSTAVRISSTLCKSAHPHPAPFLSPASSIALAHEFLFSSSLPIDAAPNGPMYSVNVYYSDPIDRTMTTGLHTVQDIYCSKCNTMVGWKYVSINSPFLLLSSTSQSSLRRHELICIEICGPGS